jgi:hypothetical protein
MTMGREVPKFVLIDSLDHAKSRSGIFWMRKNGWREILMAEVS